MWSWSQFTCELEGSKWTGWSWSQLTCELGGNGRGGRDHSKSMRWSQLTCELGRGGGGMDEVFMVTAYL